MSSPARRKEKQEQYEREQRAATAERYRRANRTVWEKIEEADASDDVKELLYLFASELKLEQ